RAKQIRLRRPLDVVSDKQVEVPISIEIDPRCARAEFIGAGEACFFCDICKNALGISEQKTLAYSRNEEILIAVVVLISHCHTPCVRFNRETGSTSHCREGSVSIVVKQMQCGRPMRLPGPVFAVGEKQIPPTVAVIVDEGNARAQRFREIFFAERAVVMSEVD